MSIPTVLHIRGSDLYGSPERLIIGQMQHMPEIRSIAASFVRPGKPSQFLEELTRLGLDHVAVDDRLKFDWRVVKQLRAIATTRKIDLIVTHDYKSAVYGYLARRKLNVPQVCYFHGWTREDFRVRFYNLLDRMVLRRCDRVVTVSQASAQRLIESGVSPNQISVVYNAISLEPNALPPERQVHQVPVIGVVGRLSYEKGVHDILQALAQVHVRSTVKFAARIFGSGPEEARLKRMATELKLNDCVSFEGFRSDLDKIYPQLDFLVMPSLSEGHPVVILEAWKHGLGIIATRAGGIPEVVEHARTGWLTDVGRPDQLALAIEEALKDVASLNRLGRAGFEEVQTTYGFQTQAARLEEIYREVMRAKHETVA